jgi:hypothetical protein
MSPPEIATLVLLLDEPTRWRWRVTLRDGAPPFDVTPAGLHDFQALTAAALAQAGVSLSPIDPAKWRRYLAGIVEGVRRAEAPLHRGRPLGPVLAVLLALPEAPEPSPDFIASPREARRGLKTLLERAREGER